MTVLCLHGAYGSAKNFEMQLRPLIDALGQPDGLDFRCVDGSYAAEIPPGAAAFHGAPPLYHFLNLNRFGSSNASRVRDLPKEATPEESMRVLFGHNKVDAFTIENAVDRLVRIIDDDPSIDSLLGHSEGAAAAASLIMKEKLLFEKHGRPRRIKFAIFFGGWPPLRGVGDSAVLYLADECDDVIDVPTCHIIGCDDPFIDGAMALYNMCDPDLATLFDHGGGHSLPRSALTIGELASTVQDTWCARGMVVQRV